MVSKFIVQLITMTVTIYKRRLKYIKLLITMASMVSKHIKSTLKVHHTAYLSDSHCTCVKVYIVEDIVCVFQRRR